MVALLSYWLLCMRLLQLHKLTSRTIVPTSVSITVVEGLDIEDRQVFNITGQNQGIVDVGTIVLEVSLWYLSHLPARTLPQDQQRTGKDAMLQTIFFCKGTGAL